jgi:hypothetical protein
MAKAQTDIRTTSYDALAARPFGYQGTIDDVIAQMRREPETYERRPRGRTELRMFLGVPPKHESVSAGPSVELDTDVRYGAEPKQQLDVLDPGFFSVAHAKLRGWI